jgi:outer membrane cobalamin receptor
MTGVVQIFTRRGTTRTPELEMVGDGGSFSTGHGSATVSGLRGGFDYSAGFGYFTTAGQGSNDAMLNRTMSGNFGYKFSDTDTLRVSVRNATSDAGIPPDAVQHINLHDFSGSIIWNAQRGPHWAWRASAHETDLRTDDNDLPFFESISQFNRAVAEAQGSYLFNSGAVTERYYYEIENGFPGALFGEHARRNNQAGYLDARWQAAKRLTVNVGARAEDNSSFGTKVVPRVGATYLLREGTSEFGETRLHAFYGQGIVEPRLDQSFGTDPCFPGNPALLPEQSKTANGGIDQEMFSGRLHLSADYFYNQFRNVISFGFGPVTPACFFGTGTFFNTDRGVARGVNFSGQLRPARWMRVAGNYSYDNSRVLSAPNAFDPNQFPGNHLLRRPVNSGTLEINFFVLKLKVNLLGYFI